MLSYQVHEFGQALVPVQRETPRPQGSEVVLRISHCGVCHSDVHLHDGYFDLGGGQRLELARSVQPPRTLGHEIAGVVTAIGPDVRDVAIGDARVVFPWIGCGDCALCRRGDEHLCNAARGLGIQRDGGFADQVLVPHPRYLLAFDPLPAEQACTCACAGLTAYAALRQVGELAADERLLIIGAGGVGLSAIRLARHLFEAPPLVAEIDRSKWDAARGAGAGELFDPADLTTARGIVKATAGGVAAALDFVGAGSSFAFGLGALRKGGQLVCIGLFGGATPVVPAMLALKALRISGSYVGSLQQMQELMDLARQGTLAPLPLTTRPLAQASEVLSELRAGSVRGRAVLIP